MTRGQRKGNVEMRVTNVQFASRNGSNSLNSYPYTCLLHILLKDILEDNNQFHLCITILINYRDHSLVVALRGGRALVNKLIHRGGGSDLCHRPL